MINEGWGVVSQVGFWGWVSCSVGLILRSFPRRETFLASRGLAWGTGLVLFFVVWVVGMLKA